jgi:hypothetical protein
MPNVKDLKIELDRKLAEQNDRLIKALRTIYFRTVRDPGGLKAEEIRAILREAGLKIPTN